MRKDALLFLIHLNDKQINLKNNNPWLGSRSKMCYAVLRMAGCVSVLAYKHKASIPDSHIFERLWNNMDASTDANPLQLRIMISEEDNTKCTQITNVI